MFGFSFGHMLLIMAIALIVIGPKQLPEVARTIGKFINELKRATGDFSKTFTDVRDDTKKTWNDTRQGINDVFTASGASYSPQRAPPAGTVSTAATVANGSDTSLGEVPSSSAPFPITPDDPFGVGHNPNAHPDYSDPQGSLFVPTDLSNVVPEPTSTASSVEEQLSFQLTSFEEDAHEGSNDQGSSRS